MILNKIKQMKKDDRGFTIVELLIVIVIIAILAAITIVAYNGIQNRAKAAAYQADANGIMKAAETVNASSTGAYPVGAPADSAAVTTAKFNVGDAKLPSNVQIKWVDAAPTASEAATGPDLTTTVGTRIYNAKDCGATVGVAIYYWDPSASAQKSVTAGTCTP